MKAVPNRIKIWTNVCGDNDFAQLGQTFAQMSDQDWSCVQTVIPNPALLCLVCAQKNFGIRKLDIVSAVIKRGVYI